MRKKRSKKSVFWILLVLICLGAAGTYVYFAERNPPYIGVTPEKGPLGKEQPINLIVKDKGSGLSSLLVEARQNATQIIVLEKTFPKKTPSWKYTFRLSDPIFHDGPLKLSVHVQDFSWAHFFQGNEATANLMYRLDTQPPVITPQSFRHNVSLGGSGVVKYNVSEPVTKTGLQIGDAFFPAYRQDDNSYICFFALPYNLETKKVSPVLIARDEGNNEGQVQINYHFKDRDFSSSQIAISSQFLQRKMPQFFRNFPKYQEAGSELFLKVNNELRTKNREKLKQIGRQTASQILWSGKFLRQPGARQAAFGVWRTYVYQGQEIDHQRHLGVDIASTARAPVKASNAGRIVYAGWFGIYGKTVIIDHGLGLQSLYGHLSQVEVKKGQRVEKGQEIGRTGATGLAGGDHLHFAILVSGIPVEPIEWWDAHWIAHNILDKFSQEE
jgi:murein DD-endopeptidase MepM/ murein hydrolase activator NlpD